MSTSPMTPAQHARQSARTSDGKYTTFQAAEDITFQAPASSDVTPDKWEPVETPADILDRIDTGDYHIVDAWQEKDGVMATVRHSSARQGLTQEFSHTLRGRHRNEIGAHDLTGVVMADIAHQSQQGIHHPHLDGLDPRERHDLVWGCDEMNPHSYNKDFRLFVGCAGPEVQDPARLDDLGQHLARYDTRHNLVDRELTGDEFNMLLAGDHALERHGSALCCGDDEAVAAMFNARVDSAVAGSVDDAHANGVIPWTSENTPEWLDQYLRDQIHGNHQGQGNFDGAAVRTPARKVVSAAHDPHDVETPLRARLLSSADMDGFFVRRDATFCMLARSGVTLGDAGPHELYRDPWPEGMVVEVTAVAKPQSATRVGMAQFRVHGFVPGPDGSRTQVWGEEGVALPSAHLSGRVRDGAGFVVVDADT